MRLQHLNLGWSPTAAVCWLLTVAMLGGCSTVPVREAAAPMTATESVVGSAIAQRAVAFIGTPYLYGGADPRGFDCSGLVYYVHGQLHIEVPRTANDQFKQSKAVGRFDVRPGDLVFFRLEGRVSHVGIYISDGRFVHAPQTGRTVSINSLDEEFYRARYVGAGRF